MSRTDTSEFARILLGGINSGFGNAMEAQRFDFQQQQADLQAQQDAARALQAQQSLAFQQQHANAQLGLQQSRLNHEIGQDQARTALDQARQSRNRMDFEIYRNNGMLKYMPLPQKMKFAAEAGMTLDPETDLTEEERQTEAQRQQQQLMGVLQLNQMPATPENLTRFGGVDATMANQVIQREAAAAAKAKAEAAERERASKALGVLFPNAKPGMADAMVEARGANIPVGVGDANLSGRAPAQDLEKSPDYIIATQELEAAERKLKLIQGNPNAKAADIAAAGAAVEAASNARLNLTKSFYKKTEPAGNLDAETPAGGGVGAGAAAPVVFDGETPETAAKRRAFGAKAKEMFFQKHGRQPTKSAADIAVLMQLYQEAAAAR